MSKDSEKGEYEIPGGSHTWEYLSAFSCTLLMMSLGNVIGWNSPILGKFAEPGSPITLTPSDASSMAALVSVGHMIAPPLTMPMVDNLGRKTSLLITGVPLIVGWGLIAVANHVVVLWIARFVSGLAIGLANCICPMYLGEVASPQLRGGMGMLITNMYNGGCILAMTVVPYLTVFASSCIFIGVVLAFVISFSFMPESPYFLVMVGRTDEAEAALEKLRGKTDVSGDMELIKDTLLEISGSADGPEKPEKANAFKRLFGVPGNRKAFFIAALFMCSHQLGGFSIVVVYGHVLFTAMGVGVEPHICTIIVAVLQSVTTILASFLVDRIGRKPLVRVSGLVSGFCLLVIGVYFYLMEHTGLDVRGHATAPFLAVFLLVVAANLGVIPIQGVVLSEIFDTDIKALATCIFGVSSGLVSTLSLKSYLLMATTWGLGHSASFLTFALVTWSCTASLMRLMPETKGKTFLQIRKDLNA